MNTMEYIGRRLGFASPYLDEVPLRESAFRNGASFMKRSIRVDMAESKSKGDRDRGGPRREILIYPRSLMTFRAVFLTGRMGVCGYRRQISEGRI